jgi:hypothetical protein
MDVYIYVKQMTILLKRLSEWKAREVEGEGSDLLARCKLKRRVDINKTTSEWMNGG